MSKLCVHVRVCVETERETVEATSDAGSRLLTRTLVQTSQITKVSQKKNVKNKVILPFGRDQNSRNLNKTLTRVTAPIQVGD